ncbi:Ig-like domain-containing protein [Gangjinia marincola]|uniref:Ig-like domain-containing protein n=1 Tax=Gangjinia marincola TaxID=578463 RepID=A0ABN1MFL2_9FLAO
MKKYLLHIILVIFVAGCEEDESTTGDTTNTIVPFSQELDWVKTFGGSDEDEATSVIHLPDGGLAVLGNTRSTDGDFAGRTGNDKDFVLMRIDAEGNLIWSQFYGGSQNDEASDLILTNDGGFAMIGSTRSGDDNPTTFDGDVNINNGFYDYWMVKTDLNGTIQWQKTFGFDGSDRGQALIQTKDGGYFLTGYFDVTASGGQGNEDGKITSIKSAEHGIGEFWGIKLNIKGELEWRRYFGGTNNDQSYDVVENQSGNFILMGHTESEDFDISQTNGSYEYWVVAVDQAGNKLWENTYGGSAIDQGKAITMLPNGDMMLIGVTRSNDGDISNSNGENADAWLVQIDQEGTLLNEYTYGGTGFDSAQSIIASPTNLFIAGNTRSEDIDGIVNNGQNDAWILMLELEGNVIWQETIGGSGLDFFNAFTFTENNVLYVVGSTESTDGDIAVNKGGKDILLVKYK